MKKIYTAPPRQRSGGTSPGTCIQSVEEALRYPFNSCWFSLGHGARGILQVRAGAERIGTNRSIAQIAEAGELGVCTLQESLRSSL